MAHSRPKRYTNWYLREWMAALNVTQSALVDKTDLTKAQVSLLVNDRQDYSPTIIRDVSAVLNIAAYELLMHPDDAMSLRRLRDDAIRVVETSRAIHRLDNDRTGTDG